MKDSKEYIEAKTIAIAKASGKTPMSDIFEAGYDFAMSQPKHIFDGVANVGEVRRYEGGLVDVEKCRYKTCIGCILFDKMIDCEYLTGCDTHNVKYIHAK